MSYLVTLQFFFTEHLSPAEQSLGNKERSLFDSPKFEYNSLTKMFENRTYIQPILALSPENS